MNTAHSSSVTVSVPLAGNRIFEATMITDPEDGEPTALLLSVGFRDGPSGWWDAPDMLTIEPDALDDIIEALQSLAAPVPLRAA